MLFWSTRGKSDMKSAAHVIKEGLAPDGGLFVPKNFPFIHMDEIMRMANKSYAECVASILQLFLTDFSREELMECTEAAYSEAKFGEDPAPLRHVMERTDVLELWHGPTLAFKDMALQLLPHLMIKSQKKTGSGEKIVILAATSGDTGKAALDGFADVEDTDIMVFYPTDGVSDIQKLQMTTQAGGNVSVFGIKGNFDDAQRGVKEIFGNGEMAEKLAGKGFCFSSANSINWGRLVPQITYYFTSYAKAVVKGSIKEGDPVIFSVPTGNFGDILAAYYAKKMGLPVKRLICASNSNNVITEFINTGMYDARRELLKTESPSMDILVSSNLERLLYDVTGGDAAQVAAWMKELSEKGFYEVDSATEAAIQEVFFGAWVDELETEETIGRIWNDYGYVLDPHTAVAWRAAEKYRFLSGDETYCITVSTASPYKFNDSVLEALENEDELKEKTFSNPFEAVRELNKLTDWEIPQALLQLEKAAVLHREIIAAEDMPEVVLRELGIE